MSELRQVGNWKKKIVQMGTKLFSLSIVTGSILTSVCLYLYFPELFVDFEPPDIKDQYFGRGKQLLDPDDFPKDKTQINKFTINIEDSVLTDLKARLKNTRYVEPLDDVAFHYGFHAHYLKKVVDHWMTKYDWRAQEKALNQFSHFTTQIEGINVHFIHEKPKIKSEEKVHVMPIMLIHGWPGSFVEFTKLIPLLTSPSKDRKYVFEVIVPSIPGYGFSEAPHQPGFSMVSAARVFSKLMDRLGFKHFYVQGGDWGAAISQTMAKLYPNRILGVHCNIVPFSLDAVGWMKYTAGLIFPSFFMSVEEQENVYPIWKPFEFYFEEGGYMHIQSTKPDTVSSALQDSPAGLAAYILEKFSTWTNRTYMDFDDGKLTERFGLDELLTNVMVYWTTNSIVSSTRFYKENIKGLVGSDPLKKVAIKVPSGVTVFPQEIIIFPKSFITSQLRDLVHYERMPVGGHFPAMEVPDVLASQIWKFAMAVEKRSQEH